MIAYTRARMGSRAGFAVAAGVLLASAAGVWFARSAPAPAADVAAGSEEAFATGLYPRELPPGVGPLRWTRPRARLRFENLAVGPAELVVDVAGHRTPVRVVADGVVVAVLERGQRGGRYAVALRRSRLDVELLTDGFEVADGRHLGTQLRRVAVESGSGGRPAVLALLLGVPAGAFGLAALGGGVLAALAASLAGAAVPLWLLWPNGACCSPWALRLSALLVLGALVARAAGSWSERRLPGSGTPAVAALLSAWVVQLVFATAPVMVVSDVLFHAHKLEEVASGVLFPTSVTQHATPFRIPYPAAFYALLWPGQAAGLDTVALVRWGAGLSGVAAAAGLFLGLRRSGAGLAALSVLLLQLEPGSFDVYSFGNLSNAFAQAMTVLVFAWWVAGGRSAGVGATLAALAAASHLSGVIVLVAWSAALVAVEGGPERRRAALALGLGLGLALLYYAAWLPLVLEQLPRLLEGGGQGRGASRGPLDVLRLQSLGAVGQWGPGALALALCGLPRGGWDRLDRALVAAFVAGAALALLALVSPVEVRYLYFLSLPVAICAARGMVRLSGRGRAGLGAALVALAFQAWVAFGALREAVFLRYRL